MRDRGFIADWIGQTDIAGAVHALSAGRYNVILTPRAHWADPRAADDWIRQVHDFGLAWVYELDDDGWSPEIVKRQARLFEQEWSKGEYQLEIERRERIDLINRADGVLVTTEALADVARRYTETPVWVVPNLINVDWFMSRLDDAKRLIQPLTIGWSGGLRDEADLDIVSQAWARIAKRYPKVKFIIHGVTPKNLASAVPNDQLILVAWSSLPDYPRTLMNIDVMCCAVADTEFNRCKSNIKWMEASLAGAACAVSNTVYGDAVRDGDGGLVCETVDDWEEALAQLVESEDRRASVVEHARQSIYTDHSLGTKWPMWPEALAGVLRDGGRTPSGLQVALSA
jgi:glycosyltransferase involved in cell wall biosynthesis